MCLNICLYIVYCILWAVINMNIIYAIVVAISPKYLKKIFTKIPLRDFKEVKMK